jgi:hypothetical protein
MGFRRSASYRSALLPCFGLTLLGCGEAPPAMPVASGAEGLINGAVASGGVYSGVAKIPRCSSVLVAPRVLLSAAHCMPAYIYNCETLANAPFDVIFPEASGGWADQASVDSRTVAVKGILHRPQFDMTSCPASAMFNCDNTVKQNMDHAQELVVLYLEDDAPPDVDPIPIMISDPVTWNSQVAGEFGFFAGLEQWVNSTVPVVTTAGFGKGSHKYDVVGGPARNGLDFGQQRWLQTETSFGDYAGTLDCNTLNTPSVERAVVVSPKDISSSDLLGATITSGFEFPGAEHSHSGKGDSGGPVIVGTGPSARGDNPTPLPPPALGDAYDPAKHYVVGTASLFVSSGETPKTAFTPTYTAGAAEFLRDALHDSDDDGYADPVDDDADNDGCENDADQHPDDDSVLVGTLLNPNCTPHSSGWYKSEGGDSDGDGLLDCEDLDDDNDDIPDTGDDCPVHVGPWCIKAGHTCPWDPRIFHCIFGACNESLRFQNVVNPDPTRRFIFPIQSFAERTVVVGPAAGLSVEESAFVLAGQVARNAAAPASAPAELFVLEVIDREQRVLTSVAAYGAASVRIGNLRGARALELRFSVDGQSVEINAAANVQNR